MSLQQFPPETQVGFYAQCELNQNQTVPLSTWTAIIFADELYDAGGDFNAATGVFTAPYDGLYEFATNICLEAVRSVYTAIFINSNERGRAYFVSTVSARTSTIMPLSVGDQVTARLWAQVSSVGICDQSGTRESTNFSGALIERT